ncbi:SDR family oxidoreductase [Alloalcanivorax profundimaris]|uniref:SDR family oxidoreductase n=1 Tax=Alloalcanivorax profundimaris TaxID=2735259 RepID=UPI001888F813|nr:SDR family oxidoreductase [Alloalcanivorax profundimaris]MBF1802180.1 SDR family oxidoreductase [Alloalcanivorax profundimaris]MCQ6261059.1 SDR family oxidoreductase [Alcanivorax sp. MM125-6]
MKHFNDKLCLITGAASGIGRATALALAGEGARLCLADLNREALEATARRAESISGRTVVRRTLDIADEQAVFELAAEVQEREGAVDVVMNIAGISIWGTIENLESRHWRKLVEINLMGPVHVLRAFLPAMIERGRGGHVVNVSSAAGLFGLPWHAAYSATKFGLRGISEVLRFDLRHHDIGVSLVCPGGVDTGLVRTIDIVGVDREDPEVQAMTQRFQRHAVTSEKAAAAILKGVRRNRYMVFTSLDIRMGYWFQRKCAWPYEIAMRVLSTRVFGLARKLAAPK